MEFAKYTRELECPKCGVALIASIEEAGYGPANEWERENCPKCGERAISMKCCSIELELKEK